MTNLGHEITTIMIAHQRSTVRHCCRTYLLEKGRVAAQDTYDELVAGNKHCRRMTEANAAP